MFTPYSPLLLMDAGVIGDVNKVGISCSVSGFVLTEIRIEILLRKKGVGELLKTSDE